MRLKYYIVLILGAGLMACSAVNNIYVSGESIPVTEVSEQNNIDSIVAPYKKELDKEMLRVIATAPDNFTKGRPNGSLNNWAADAIITYQINGMDMNIPTLCLLNTGGLRSPINKGDVTVGDIYRLMPFDNEIVWVVMPKSVIPEIEAYMKNSGGEPISGATIVKGKLELLGDNDSLDYFHIITSDYLLNGGDKMTFFEKSTKVVHTGDLMRDAMLEVARVQKELYWNNDEVITF